MARNAISHTSKVSKGAKIRNRYNQVSHLTQDTIGKVTNSQQDTTNESQEVSPFPAGDHTDAHKGIVNTRQKKTHKNPQKKFRLGTVSKILYWRAYTGLKVPTSPLIQMWIKTHIYLVCMKPICQRYESISHLVNLLCNSYSTHGLYARAWIMSYSIGQPRYNSFHT